MKKVLSLMFCLLTFNVVANAQDPEEPQEVLVYEVNENEEQDFRSPQVVPIICEYCPLTNIVNLYFASNQGLATICLNNLTEGTMDVYEQNGPGTAVIPIYEGYIIIDIYTQDGRHYRAMFVAI